MECTDCQAGAQCTNRALQSLTSPPLTFSGGNLTVTTNLEAGAVLGQFTGEVMARETFQTRLEEEYAQQDFSLYVFPLTEQLVVDATSKGSVIRWDLIEDNNPVPLQTSTLRFASHSCSPNAEISVWKVSGLDCLAVTAMKEIQAGETLSLDLSPAIKVSLVCLASRRDNFISWQFLGTSKRCSCNAGNCRILLGSSAVTRGPVRCGGCLQQLLEAGKVGKVLLHPELSTPVCEGCQDRHHQQGGAQSGVCSWCSHQADKTLLSCVSCPRSFCRKCLQQNLGPSYIKLATTGSWSCLVCNAEPLTNIRRPLWLEGEQERQRQPVKSGPSRNFSPRASPSPAVRNFSPRALPSPAVRMAGRSISSPAAMRSPAPRGTPSPAARGSSPGVRPSTPRQPMRLVRPARPGTPRVRMPPPAGPGRPAAPYPVRMLGNSNVSIERVARPPQPPPPQHKPATASIISQLQRYSGLSIKPVSQSTSSLESACSHLESLQRSILTAASQVSFSFLHSSCTLLIPGGG